LLLSILAMAFTVQRLRMLKLYNSMLSWCFNFWSGGWSTTTKIWFWWVGQWDLGQLVHLLQSTLFRLWFFYHLILLWNKQ
jgi:hypothetical protein